MIDPCLLIPIYNNKDTIGRVLDEIAPLRLPCIIVNDGSDTATRQVLEDQEKQRKWLQVLHLPDNSGKGAAAQAGFLRAYDAGYSHVLLLDADGQHNTRDIPRFLAEAASYPKALILGKPVFGEDAPRSRVIGRKISQLWVRIETFSWVIGDPLFGFRVYPVPSVMALIKKKRLGSGMDFDTDIAVRLYWEGIPMRNIDTTVRYPEGGLSHFRMFRDNLRISWLHTRLFFGMLCRVWRLLMMKRNP